MTGKTNANGKSNESGILTSGNEVLNKTFETFARLGYAARGVIYFIFGLLAVLMAFGYAGKTTDQQGAIAMIGSQPAGRILLSFVLIGLGCYSLWGLIRALLNPFRHGHDAKGFARRVGYMMSAAAYALLVIPTYSLISGGAQPAHNGAQQYIAKSLVNPFGQWLVGIFGLIVIAAGLIQFFQGFNSGFERQIYLAKLDPVQLRRVRCFGRFGTIARGIVVGLIGLFIVVTSNTGNSQQVKSFDSTLTGILQQPYGRWLMGAVALGLISLGLYSLCQSIFFRLKKYETKTYLFERLFSYDCNQYSHNNNYYNNKYI